MRGPEIGVAVALEPAPELDDEPAVLLPDDCHIKAANTPPSTNNNMSRILALVMSKRRRFRGPRLLLPSLPSSPVEGGTGGGSPRETLSITSALARNVPAAGVATASVSSACGSGSGGVVSSGPVGVVSREPVVAVVVSCASTAGLFPHKKMAGIIAIRESIMVAKNTAL